jgi:RNA polymerase sigma-70 factor (ECF subfamily)
MTDDSVADEDLMLQFKNGSGGAFERLFARYRQPIFAFFHRRLEGHHRAQDLTQETFLAIVQSASRWEPRAPVKTFLFSIALKQLYAERRKQATRRAGDLDEEAFVNEERDQSLWVREALQKLDDDEREILMLREYEQLSYEEIAELLNVPLNTVRSRLFRARVALKRFLEPAPTKVEA